MAQVFFILLTLINFKITKNFCRFKINFHARLGISFVFSKKTKFFRQRHNLFSPPSHRRRFSIINRTIKLYFRSMVLMKPQFSSLRSFSFSFPSLLWCYCNSVLESTNIRNRETSTKIISFFLCQLLQSSFTPALCYTVEAEEGKQHLTGSLTLGSEIKHPEKSQKTWHFQIVYMKKCFT